MKQERPPIWETAVMAGSFSLIWAWWLAYQAAQKNAITTEKVQLAIGWDIALWLAVGALAVVLVRRFLRVHHALKSGHPARRTPENN